VDLVFGTHLGRFGLIFVKLRNIPG